MALAAACLVWSISCIAADNAQLASEACSLIAQQRNSLSDAVAVAEARRKIDGEDTAKLRQQLADFRVYFKAYIGESP